MSAPQAVVELVERFNRYHEVYRSGRYNETQVRREFIDQLFELFGWDINNKHGYAEAYKDVIHEDAIKIGGVTKAPDYCFRIGGTRKFFLEAKNPSINIRVHHDLCYAVPCTKGGTSDVTVSRSSHPYQRGVGFDELDRGQVDRAGPRV